MLEIPVKNSRFLTLKQHLDVGFEAIGIKVVG